MAGRTPSELSRGARIRPNMALPVAAGYNNPVEADRAVNPGALLPFPYLENRMVNTWRFGPNDLIIRENDPGESAYIIESGRVAVTKESNGRQIHIAVLEKGATFGEMGMVDDLPRSASVTALE